jgi:hypothetical protein
LNLLGKCLIECQSGSEQSKMGLMLNGIYLRECLLETSLEMPIICLIRCQNKMRLVGKIRDMGMQKQVVLMLLGNVRKR